MFNGTSIRQDNAKHDDELKYPHQLPPTLQSTQYGLQQSPQQLHQPLQHPQSFPFQPLQQPFQRQQQQPQQPQYQQGVFFQRHQPMLPSILSQQQQQPPFTQDQPPQFPTDPSLSNSKPSEEGADNSLRQDVQSVMMRKSKSGTDGTSDENLCPFCNKQFAHKGSFLRHLETRKGDSWHPIDECNNIKNQQTRRKSIEVSTLGYGGSSVGSITSMDSTPMGKSSSRKRRVTKKSLARSQMSSDLASGQKEKSKLRRKLHDRRIKAKIITNEWLINQFTKKPMPDQDSSPATFCQFIAFYVPIKNWPSLNEIPNSSLYDEVLNQLRKIEQEDLNTLFIQSMQAYEQLDPTERKRIWLEEIQNCLNSSISNFTLFDLNNIKSIIDRREQLIFEGICANDNLSEFVGTEDNPTLEEEEEAEDHEEEDADASTQGSQHTHNHVQPPFSYTQQRHLSTSQFTQPQSGPAYQQQQPPPPPPPHQSLRSNSLPHNSYLPHLPNISNNDYNDFSSSHFF
ncbi:hypothetical protein I9W82_005691 [Candida metapsilosis]|uniref:C2H2-type domain-containing protein n=1 Tax=Candida metapsilosis TaxID=273372 RepID=A0A8H7Z7L6_9ASCO|nr:hypothetical protein I9W82_005691 [Candida metapsilosis]